MNERDASGEDPTIDGEDSPVSGQPAPAQHDETEPAEDDLLDGYQPV